MNHPRQDYTRHMHLQRYETIIGQIIPFAVGFRKGKSIEKISFVQNDTKNERKKNTNGCVAFITPLSMHTFPDLICYDPMHTSAFSLSTMTGSFFSIFPSFTTHYTSIHHLERCILWVQPIPIIICLACNLPLYFFTPHEKCVKPCKNNWLFCFSGILIVYSLSRIYFKMLLWLSFVRNNIVYNRY